MGKISGETVKPVRAWKADIKRWWWWIIFYENSAGCKTWSQASMTCRLLMCKRRMQTATMSRHVSTSRLTSTDWSRQTSSMASRFFSNKSPLMLCTLCKTSGGRFIWVTPTVVYDTTFKFFMFFFASDWWLPTTCAPYKYVYDALVHFRPSPTNACDNSPADIICLQIIDYWYPWSFMLLLVSWMQGMSWHLWHFCAVYS